jgi:DNA-binding beta-propeller fold protein YncE
MKLTRRTSRIGKTCFGRCAPVLVALLMISLIFICGFNNRSPSSDTALMAEINIQKLVNGFDKNIIKQNNAVYDPSRNKIYVSGGLTESTFAVINPQTDTIEDLFDIGLPGGIMALSDDGSGMLYIMNTGARSCVKYNPDTKTAVGIPDQRECQNAVDSPRTGIGRQRVWGDITMIAENTWNFPRYKGYAPTSTQNLNALYNKIKLIRNHSEIGEIIHGPDTMFFDVDTKDGKIYASNTGDSSISVFDLKKLASTNRCAKDSCWIKDIRLGTTIDEILLDSSGNIYVRNRLGGSTIYKYNQSTKSISLFADNENNLSRKQAIWNSSNWHGGGISMWPTGFAIRNNGKEMYVLSHYNACVGVIDTATGNFLSKILFPVPWKPRTDSLSEIAMDYASNRMFAVWPELGLIGVADLTNRRVVKMIDLAQYGFDRNRSANRGLGLVKLAYNARGNKLYIFLTDNKNLIMLDGKTFVKQKETRITTPVAQVDSHLISNDDKGELYLGEHIFDALGLTPKGDLAPHQVNIVGFNNSDNSIYADEIITDRASPGRYSNILRKYVGGKPAKDLVIRVKAVLPAKYYFDTANNKVYVYFLADAIIMKYDLQKM